MPGWVIEIDEEQVKTTARWCFERGFTTQYILSELAKLYTPLGDIVKEIKAEYYPEADTPEKEKHA